MRGAWHPTPPTPNQQMPSTISATGAPPLLVEAKRCEAKAPPKKFNTQARMSVGGKGPLWCKEKLAQAQRVVVVINDEDEGEKRQDKEPPTPRHSFAFSELKGKTTSSTLRSRRTMRGTMIGRAT